MPEESSPPLTPDEGGARRHQRSWCDKGENEFSSSLVAGRAEVWCLFGEDLADPELFRQGISELSALEVARAERFVRQEDRDRFIIGRWMLRHQLSKYIGVRSDRLVFNIDERGRPELSGHNTLRIHFNLSHTDGLIACGFMVRHPIGVDAERVQDARVDMDVAQHGFPPGAHRDVLEAPLECRAQRFFEHWVLMEAYAKARGCGLTDMQPASFVFVGENRLRFDFTPCEWDNPRDWSFHLGAPTTDHLLAIAVGGAPGRPPEIRRMRGDGSSEPICPTVRTSHSPPGRVLRRACLL